MTDPVLNSGFILQEDSYPDLEIYRRDDVALISMKKFKSDKKSFRVAANHLDQLLVAGLKNAVREAEQDEGIRAVILASSHKVAFSRGARIELLLELTPGETRQFIGEAQSLLLQIQSCVKPVIAAVGGLALGGGMELAMGCDCRIASSRENVVFGLPEAALGIIPAMGGTQNLPRIVGREKALDLILHARTDITPAQAADWGLVDLVVPESSLYEEAFRYAQSFHAAKPEISGPPDKNGDEIQAEITAWLKDHPPDPEADPAVAPVSRSLVSMLFEKTGGENYLEGLLYEKEVFLYLSGTADCREGITALNEERRPIFHGK